MSKTSARTLMRRPPKYWWDFKHYPDGSMTIVLETDDPRCENGVVEETPPLPEGPADAVIDAILVKIADLDSGRVIPRYTTRAC